MSPKSIIRLTNIIGVISIILLLYWVFAYMINEVFEMRIFRENISQTFALSVLGILALMGGALIINVMFNLTRIAQKLNNDEQKETLNSSKKYLVMLILGFPIIAGLMVLGNHLSNKKKEKYMLHSAENILNNNLDVMPYISNYSYNLNWLRFANEFCTYQADHTSHFHRLDIITSDTLFGKSVLMSNYYRIRPDTILPVKKSYTAQFDNEIENYLHDALKGRTKEFRFDSHDGSFILYYPLTVGEHTVVFLFSDYMSYGKFGR